MNNVTLGISHLVSPKVYYWPYMARLQGSIRSNFNFVSFVEWLAKWSSIKTKYTVYSIIKVYSNELSFREIWQHMNIFPNKMVLGWVILSEICSKVEREWGTAVNSSSHDSSFDVDLSQLRRHSHHTVNIINMMYACSALI